MSENRLDAGTREAAIRTWLHSAPDAVAIALAPTSERVPLPRADCFAGVATLPGTQATFVDTVVPEDRMAVVTTWERAQRAGAAESAVRLLSDPGRGMRLAFVDATDVFGAWIGLLAEQGAWQPGPAVAAIDARLLTARRPRTGTLGKNLYAVITRVDARLTAMLGWTAAEMIGRRSLEFMHPDDHERAIAQWLEVRSTHASQRVRVRHRHRDGQWLWVEIENTFLGLADPEATVVSTLITDISDEMAAHETVRQQERLLRRLADSLPIGLLVIAEDRTVVFASAGLPRVLGVTSVATLDELLARVHAADRPRLDEALAATLHLHTDCELEVRLGEADGEHRFCRVTLAALTEEEGLRGAVASVADVTASSRLREELATRATYDALTGCHNRASARAELDRALAGPGAAHTAAYFVDLDGFKAVNDSYGHVVGDRLLVEVARRLAGVLRADDTLGRWGGDEFLVVCPQVRTSCEALSLVARIEGALSPPVRVDGYELRVAASVGYAVAGPAADAEDLIARADAAMYAAKRAGSRRPLVSRPPAPPAA